MKYIIYCALLCITLHAQGSLEEESIKTEQGSFLSLGASFVKAFMPAFVFAATGCAAGIIQTDKNSAGSASVIGLISSSAASYYIAQYYSNNDNHPYLAQVGHISGALLGTMGGLGAMIIIKAKRGN